jgi:hypothetical protein
VGYDIHIRHVVGTITLPEWRDAVEATDGVRLCSGDTRITNPKTGEVTTIANSGGDTEFFLAEKSKWIRAFRWRPSVGDICFRLTPEFNNPSSALRSTARQLALRLGAHLIGDGGEAYDL